ncbi:MULTISPECIES: TMEM175 family protein [Subtercola]|uniref:DUF1211 domain-containing protein n=1 Tax=Subtercola vilae TaxID=2056433 RepID=A0A4T2C822_9MICO|nr:MULTISPECIES: TMEM175 family protein [Subtercola]MEA9986398.1 TMEM175 family protein [Subtercola sp. RTI3]TIH40330.1 DUF1211 domain-containing protein [Subtercola vilae]
MAKAVEHRGFDRLVNLSDAVVAIAITLLVLPLVDAAGAIGDTPVPQFMADNGVKFFVFALSFVVIARFWVIHHAMYRNLEAYNRPLIYANFLWLISIVFLPFPTELLASGSESNHATSILYIGTLALTTVAGLAQQIVIVRDPELQRVEVRKTLHMRVAIIAASIMLVALAVTIIVPTVNQWPLLLLLLTGPIEHFLLPRRGASAPARATAPLSPNAPPEK